MKKKTKRTILTSVITLGATAILLSGATLINNLVNNKGTKILNTDIVRLNNVEFDYLEEASKKEGSPSEHKVYMSYETDDFVLIALNYMDDGYEDLEDFAFTFGDGYGGNTGSFYVISPNKILDVSLPEYDLSFTGGYVKVNNPSTSATQVAWDVKDYVDIDLGNENWSLDCYIYELSLNNDEYDNHDINKIEILFAE